MSHSQSGEWNTVPGLMPSVGIPWRIRHSLFLKKLHPVGESRTKKLIMQHANAVRAVNAPLSLEASGRRQHKMDLKG